MTPAERDKLLEPTMTSELSKEDREAYRRFLNDNRISAALTALELAREAAAQKLDGLSDAALRVDDDLPLCIKLRIAAQAVRSLTIGELLKGGKP